MSRGERKIIFFLFILIVILSCFMVYKIKSKPQYDENLYNEIYAEYDQLFLDYNVIEDIDEDNIIENDNTIYLNVDSQGNKYRVAGKISIPKININYPIIFETTDEYLKIAPTKLFGPNINEVGNFCIVAHNNKNDTFFSRLSELNIGDKIILSSNKGEDLVYFVYDKFEIDETDMSCTNQNTNGNIEATLITCTNKRKSRFVVKCRA